MIPLTTVARGQDSRVAEPGRMVAGTAAEWSALWAAHAGPGAAPPPIDFSSTTVAAAFAGERPSAGHGIEIAGAVEEDGGVRLFVEERAPGPGMVAAQIITSPYHIVSFARRPGEIAWAASGTEGRGPMADSRGPKRTDSRFSAIDHRPSTIDPRSSSTGLKPTTAAALAYLAGPVSGATILLAESRSEFVRFHAWQAILGIGGGGVAVIACYVLAFTSLFVSATAVAALVRVATALWLALIVMWVICIWQAWSGRRWKLPLAGAAAARLSTRGS